MYNLLCTRESQLKVIRSTHPHEGNTQLHAHTHTQSLVAVKWWYRPSEVLGCLCTTQVLRANACKFTWGRASTKQVGLYRVPRWWCGYLKSHTHYQDKDNSSIFASPVITRYPLMLQLGELLPWLIPGPHSTVGWLKQCEQVCRSRKQ